MLVNRVMNVSMNKQNFRVILLKLHNLRFIYKTTVKLNRGDHLLSRPT